MIEIIIQTQTVYEINDDELTGPLYIPDKLTYYEKSQQATKD